ncbi:unnamed protein product, partial [Ectocarpus fasciculatus]
DAVLPQLRQEVSLRQAGAGKQEPGGSRGRQIPSRQRGSPRPAPRERPRTHGKRRCEIERREVFPVAVVGAVLHPFLLLVAAEIHGERHRGPR